MTDINIYSKRQKISTDYLPTDCVPYTIPSTDVEDSLIRILPVQLTALTVGSGQNPYMKFVLPKMKSIRMNNIIVACDLTLTMSSTNTGDVYGTNCLPTFVPNIASIINRFTLNIGASVFCDCYARDLCWNIQYNLGANAITRNDDLYKYGPGNPLNPAGTSTNGVGSSTTAVTVRFPLQYNRYDFPNLSSGLLPLGALPITSLDLYFTPPQNCMYYTYTSAPAGTITLSYTVANLQLWVEETWGASIDSQLAAQGLNFSYQEWYYQSFPITANSTTTSINLPNRFRWVHAVVIMVRKVTDITAINAGTTSNPTTSVVNKLRQCTGDLTEVTKANLRISGILRYQENLVGSLQLVHELKKIFPSASQCDYFQNITANGTTNSLYVFRVGRSFAADRESGTDNSALSASATVELTWTSALQNTNYQADTFILHTRYCSFSGSGGVNITE